MIVISFHLQLMESGPNGPFGHPVHPDAGKALRKRPGHATAQRLKMEAKLAKVLPSKKDLAHPPCLATVRQV